MYRQCSIRLSSSRLCPVHASYHFRKENCVKKQLKLLNKHKINRFLCTTILVLAPSYNTLYTWRGPIAIAIVEVMPRVRVMYSNANKHSSSTLR